MAWLILCGIIAIAFLAFRGRIATKQDDRLSSEREIHTRALSLRDALSREPFGEDLTRAVWLSLMRAPIGEGVIYDRHRDFCGQGLIRTIDGVKLCDIHDGGVMTGEPIAAWTNETDFVAFFARQSDFSCSGWDAASEIFASDDEWYRNNQRLTRAVLERYVS